jgi:aryl-alcohol dehydrogenase-like predicted oxidoreductase
MMKNRVGLGTFPLADVFSKITKDEAKSIVRQFINQDGYYFDTAPMYGFGEVELLLGRVFKEFSRDQYYVATKCGYVDVEGKTFQTIKKSGKYDDVICECERSLKRMGLDYIDLYFVHSPDKNTPFEETMRALEKLHADGKIKEIGVSNVNLDELKEYNKTGKVSYIQNRFNLITRSISRDFEEYLWKNKIKLIPYHLLEIGLLTGIAFENYQLRKGDLREGLKYWNKENQDIIFAWVREKLSPLAKGLGINIGQLNIAWALHNKLIDFVIVGTTNPKYLTINLKANEIRMTDKTLEEIEGLYCGLEREIKEKYGVSVREFRGLNEKYY